MEKKETTTKVKRELVEYDVFKDEWNTRFIMTVKGDRSIEDIQEMTVGTMVMASKMEAKIMNRFLNRKTIVRHLTASEERQLEIGFDNSFNLPQLVVIRTKGGLICVSFKLFNVAIYVKETMTKHKPDTGFPYIE